MEKNCIICGEVFEAMGMCLTCNKECQIIRRKYLKKVRLKEWRKNNPEKAKAYAKEWRKNNPEKVKEWRKNNPEKVKEWRKNNPEKVKEILALRHMYGTSKNVPIVCKKIVAMKRVIKNNKITESILTSISEGRTNEAYF